MYCRQCYTDLTDAADRRCPKCGRPFDPADPRTTLARPFPSPWRIVVQVIGTTALAVAVAYVVAWHQLARTSGH
jgi:predicted amidophosphoribosyltransferase